MTTFVEMIAPTCQSGDAFMRNGYDGMICSQKRTPVTKKLVCISPMCTSWFSSAASKRAGTCQSTMTTLNEIERRPRVDDETPGGTQGVARSDRAETRTQDPPAEPHRQAVEKRQPWGAGDDEDRREERDEDVLDHVHEEVVVGPVVDRRRHGEQQDWQGPHRRRASSGGACGSVPAESDGAGWPGPFRAARRAARRRS